MMSSVGDVNESVSDGVSNLNLRDSESELGRALSYAKCEGEIFIDRNQDPDGKLEATLINNLHGLHVVQVLDDNMVVLALHTDDNIVLSDSVTVDAELQTPEMDDSAEGYRGRAEGVLPDTPKEAWTWLPEPVLVDGAKIHDEGQEVWAEAFFRTGHCREGGSLIARLYLDEINFGVSNSSFKKDKDKEENKDKLGYFIYKVTVAAKPFGPWQKGGRVSALPSPLASENSRDSTFQVGVTVSASAVNPFALTAQRAKKKTRTRKEFDWLPCEVDSRKTKSVTWTWEMHTWKGGQKFNPRGTVSYTVKMGDFPELPFDPTGFPQRSNDFIADAYWQIPEAREEDLPSVVWSVEMKLHYVAVEKALKLGNALSICKKPDRREFKIESCVYLLGKSELQID